MKTWYADVKVKYTDKNENSSKKKRATTRSYN